MPVAEFITQVEFSEVMELNESENLRSSLDCSFKL